MYETTLGFSWQFLMDNRSELGVDGRAGAVARHDPAGDRIGEARRRGEVAVVSIAGDEGRVESIATAGRVERRVAAGLVGLGMAVVQHIAAVAIELERDDRTRVALAQLLGDRRRLTRAGQRLALVAVGEQDVDRQLGG